MFQIKVIGHIIDPDDGTMAPFVFSTSMDSAVAEGQARVLFAEMQRRFPPDEGWTVQAFKVIQVERVVRDYTEVFLQPPIDIITPAPLQLGVV